MMADIVPSECKQNRTHEPPDGAYDEEFFCAQVSQPKNVAEVIFWKSRYQKQQKNEECTFMMEKIIISVQGLFFDEFTYKWSPEISRQAEGDPRANGQTYCGEYNAEDSSIKKPADKACNFSRNWRNNNLRCLKNYKTDKG